MPKWWKPVVLVLISFALAVSLKSDFLFFLLGFELMVCLAAFCQVLWLSRKVRLRVIIPQPRVLRGESFQIRAELSNGSRFPIPRLLVRLAVRSFPEEEELLLKGKLMLDGEERGCLCFQLDSDRCGCLECRPDQLLVTDCLGLFQRRCRIDSGEKCLLFVLPETLHGEGQLPDAQGVFPDEDGSGQRQGSTATDVSEIRGYQKGDSLKLVHWKLTARLDELMVKEMMDPTEKLTWLYLNLRESPDLPPVRRNPEAWDHFVETVASLSAMLLKLEKRHLVLWIDSHSGALARSWVSDETSLQDMLCGLLRTDSFLPKDDSPLLKEITLDETKGACIEIDLQGNLARAKMP